MLKEPSGALEPWSPGGPGGAGEPPGATLVSPEISPSSKEVLFWGLTQGSYNKYADTGKSKFLLASHSIESKRTGLSPLGSS